MYRTSLAAAILGVGALVMCGPAQAAPPQQSGVILAQWGPGGPPPGAGGNPCWRLRRQLQRLYAIRDSAPPWQQPTIQPGIRQTRMQLRYNCPGYY
jgi:hypothetical protein